MPVARNAKPIDVAVIGGGVMGLACAHELLKKGMSVTLFEKDDRLGGMSASFDFDGDPIERYYHFICLPDRPFFELLDEIGLSGLLRWRKTTMGFYCHGQLHGWGSPINLLRFPHLGMVAKFRYGLHIFLATKRNKWLDLDRIGAIDWIKKNVGAEAYELVWESLFELKFFENKNDLSAAWIWSRLKRVGQSRENIFHEKLGYLQGGTSVFLQALAQRIAAMGGKIELNSSVNRIDIQDGKLKGLTMNGDFRPFDAVVSTIPLPYIPGMAPGLPSDLSNAYASLKNIGVICLIMKLKEPLTPHFWLNINSPDIDIPGAIEYTNLNPLQPHIAYFPFYLPETHPFYPKPDSFFYEKVLSYCQKINPRFAAEWVLGWRVHRYRYAQPMCTKGFLDILPPIRTEIPGLFIADTSHYYPEDRSISESVRLGRQIAGLLQPS